MKEMTDEQTMEMARLASGVIAFAAAMTDRLREKLMQGYSGWNDPEKVTTNQLLSDIAKDAGDMDLDGNSEKAVDIANRCMMLWLRE